MTNPNLSNLPSPAAKRIALRVSAQAERALHQNHPWIFDQAITEQSHQGDPGDLAVIFDNKRRFVAIGLYDPTSSIRVRILQHHQPATIDESWFKKKLVTASQIRQPLAQQSTDGYRLVHGENDGLPGLVVDRYAKTLVLKIYSLIWIPHLKEFCAALLQVCPSERLILRISRSLQKQSTFLYGLEDGITLSQVNHPKTLSCSKKMDLPLSATRSTDKRLASSLTSVKTGRVLKNYPGGKSVLNVFAYTGGFSVYAACGGATQVVSVDISAPALQAAIHNFSHNQHIPAIKSTTHEIIAEDAFEVLTKMESHKRLFDLVIIDPPMFAQNQSQVAAGLSAYRKLTHLGLGALRAGGILVQASCSSRIDAETFFGAIHQSARETNRGLKEIERTGHALDHPIGFNEGEYLKCLFATVS